MWQPVIAQNFITTAQKLSAYAVESQKGRDALEEQVANIFDGMDWVNHRLRQEKQYCQPNRLALTGPQILDMVRREVAEDPKLGDEPIGLAILVSVTRIFPCPKNSN